MDKEYDWLSGEFMKRNRFFLSLLFMVLIVLFVILFLWLGRENIKMIAYSRSCERRS